MVKTQQLVTECYLILVVTFLQAEPILSQVEIILSNAEKSLNILIGLIMLFVLLIMAMAFGARVTELLIKALIK